MQENIVTGFLFVVIAGVFAGAFALPMKFTKTWKWQHNWIIFVLWAMFIMPIIIALATIPHLWLIYQSADTVLLFKVFLMGMAWGVGVVCFGLGLEYLGIALGLSVMLGLMISLGALLPVIIFHPDELASGKGHDILLASVIILAGIIVCAVSGAMRDRKKTDNDTTGTKAKRPAYAIGLVIAITAGLLSALQNIGFVMADPIKEMAVQSGANPVFAGNAVWPILMAGCFLVNFLYCAYLINKNKEWALFWTCKKWYWPVIITSGIMWFLCMLFFGMAAAKLGKLGPSIGWASFQTLAIVTGNFAGLFTGEWNNAGRPIRILNFIGIGFLIAGIVVMAF